MKKRIAIVGAGPAGSMCACNLSHEFDITIFDTAPLKTILPTGGGRCNLAYNEYDFKELAKNYPRGEKFLYSIFSQFSTADTINFFSELGLETYVQKDGRIFPVSNSSKDVREKMLKKLKHCKFKKEKVNEIKKFEYCFEINGLNFDYVVVAIGGHSNLNILKNFHHTIIEPKPALVGLKSKENFSNLKGVSLKNVLAKFNGTTLEGDILFTHTGISGPLIYKISSIMAKKNLPYSITLDFINKDINLQNLFNKNPHKELQNLLSELLPKSMVKFFLNDINILEKCHQVTSNTKELIIKNLRNKEIIIIAPSKDGEIVTCGGISLNEINPKTLESKQQKGLYFCGEILDIDGFCGGFNLQNCWSNGYVVANSLNVTIY